MCEPVYPPELLEVLQDLQLTPEEALSRGVITPREAESVRWFLDRLAIEKQREIRSAERLAQMELAAQQAASAGWRLPNSGLCGKAGRTSKEDRGFFD